MQERATRTEGAVMPTGWTTTDIPDQHGRMALVTGANTGIGFHQALELARKGAHVLLAARDPERGGTARSAILQELPAANVELVRLDLADLESVRHLADQLLDRDHGLDPLINPAGGRAGRQRSGARGGGRASPPPIQPVRVGLAGLESVRHLADQLLDRDHGLGLLINNAGVMAVPQ